MFSSVQFICSVVSDSLQPHELQHARPPCPSSTPGVHSDSPPSSRWCHPAISSSVVPFFSCPQSLPASESFPMSQLFTWGGQSTGVSASASFPPKNTQDWSPSEWTGWISLQWWIHILCLEKKWQQWREFHQKQASKLVRREIWHPTHRRFHSFFAGKALALLLSLYTNSNKLNDLVFKPVTA